MNGARLAERAEGVASGAAHRDLPTFGANCDVGDIAETSVNRDYRTEIFPVAFNGSPCPSQIAQSFFPHVCNSDDIDSRCYVECIENIQGTDHSGDAQAIITNAWSAQNIAIASHCNRHCGGEDRICMGQKHQDRTLAFFPSAYIHIANGVDFRGIIPLLPERSHKISSFSLASCRCGDLANAPRQIRSRFNSCLGQSAQLVQLKRWYRHFSSRLP